MMRVVWILLVVLLTVLPGHAQADTHGLSQSGQSPACSELVYDDEPMGARSLKCMSGVAVKVSRTGMNVRPVHGDPLQVRFTAATVFETESGEGVLTGLVRGDYVCLSYMPHVAPVSAHLVVFDPMRNPCSGRRRHSHLTTTFLAVGSA